MRLLLITLITLLFFNSCDKECENTTGTLAISFKPIYTGSSYVMFDDVNALNNDLIDFSLSRFEFFIQGLTLHNDNDSISLSLAEYIDITQLNTEQKAMDGFTLKYDSLTPASYNQISFTVGLTDDINSTTPDQYSTQSPLGLVSNYWAGWNSYILSKLEGNTTRNDTSTGSFLIHSGVNGMSVVRSFDLPIEIVINEQTDLIFNLAIDSLFYSFNNAINVDTSNMSHSGSPGSEAYNIAKKSLSNIANSILPN